MSEPCTARIKNQHSDERCALAAGHEDPEYGTEHGGPEHPVRGRLRWSDSAAGAVPHQPAPTEATEATDADTCRTVEVDGETVRFRGSGDLTEEGREALGALVRVAKAEFVQAAVSETTGLDKARRYLRPVAHLKLPDEPDLVHLSLYEWLPSFEAWATGLALCGRSTSQGPLREGTEVTCPSCRTYEPSYQTALDLQAGLTMRTVPEPVPIAQGDLHIQVRAAVRESGLKQKWMADRLHVSDKHLSQLLTGRVALTLDWAERILALCGMELVVSVRPKRRAAR